MDPFTKVATLKYKFYLTRPTNTGVGYTQLPPETSKYKDFSTEKGEQAIGNRQLPIPKRNHLKGTSI